MNSAMAYQHRLRLQHEGIAACASEFPPRLRGRLTKHFGSRRQNDPRRNRLMRRKSLQCIGPRSLD